MAMEAPATAAHGVAARCLQAARASNALNPTVQSTAIGNSGIPQPDNSKTTFAPTAEKTTHSMSLDCHCSLMCAVDEVTTHSSADLQIGCRAGVPARICQLRHLGL